METVIKNETIASKYLLELELFKVSQVAPKYIPSLFTCFLASLIILIVYKQSQNTRKYSQDGCRKRQRILQGPSTLPLFGAVHHFLMPGVDRLQLALIWALKYGDVCLVKILHFKFYFVNDPAMIQKVLASSNPNHLNKPKFVYNTVFPGRLTDGLVSGDAHIWGPHRKTLIKTFAFKAQKSYLGPMNIHSREMIDNLKNSRDIIDNNVNEQLSSNNFDDELHHATIKTMLHVIIGPNTCTLEEIHCLQKYLEIGKEVVMHRILHPWLLLEPLFWLHPNRRALDECIDFYETFVHKVTEKKRMSRELKSVVADEDGNADGITKAKCMVDEMLDAGMSDKEIVDEFCAVVVAGHDTICLGINFLFLQLAVNPREQELCREEVDAIFSNVKGTGDDLNMDDVCNMKYLERCVYETLRLTPTIPGFVRRLDEAIDLDDDVRLEAGSNVAIVSYTVHRNPEIYPEPDKFKPDRFLPENCKARHAYAYIPFSAGPRNCIGMKFGMIEMKVIAAHMLRNFEICTKHRKLEDCGVDFQAATLHANEGFQLYFKRRTDLQ